MIEYVGAKINNVITNDLIEIIKAVKSGSNVDPLSRTSMKLMAAFDLGKRWSDLANAPTLFTEKDDGSFCFGGEK